MTKEESNEAKIAKAIGLDKVVPAVYTDLLQPATKELGKGLEITAKAVNLALLPLKGLIWGAGEIEDFLTQRLAIRLKDIPPEKVVAPRLAVAGPAIEALRFCGQDAELRELFVNLLAAAMNSDSSEEAHPAFVEVIKQLTPDEARILSYFSSFQSFPEVGRIEFDVSHWALKQNEKILNELAFKCERLVLEKDEQIHSYLDNLRRLQLFEIAGEYQNVLQEELMYHDLDIDDLRAILGSDKTMTEEAYFTSFGEQFVNVCIKNEPVEE